MKRRDFIASRAKTLDDYQEVSLFVLADDNYENFTLYEEIEKENKKIAIFKSKDINNTINSEKKISNFIAKLSGYRNVYSLNNFRNI